MWENVLTIVLAVNLTFLAWVGIVVLIFVGCNLYDYLTGNTEEARHKRALERWGKGYGDKS